MAQIHPYVKQINCKVLSSQYMELENMGRWGLKSTLLNKAESPRYLVV